MVFICGLGLNFITMKWAWGIDVHSWSGLLIMTIVNGIFHSKVSQLVDQVKTVMKYQEDQENQENNKND